MADLNAVLSKLHHLNLSGTVDDIQPTNEASSVGASRDEFTARLKYDNTTTITVRKLRISSDHGDMLVKVRVSWVELVIVRT